MLENINNHPLQRSKGSDLKNFKIKYRKKISILNNESNVLREVRYLFTIMSARTALNLSYFMTKH